MKPDVIQPLEEEQIFITSGECEEREVTCSNTVWAIQSPFIFSVINTTWQGVFLLCPLSL